MAKPPDKPKKDPARPTRAKAARPDDKPTPDTLADLLNPGIGRGTAGLGSGTGLQPPPDNSWDRRRDFSAAHTARKSAKAVDKPESGFKEAAQRSYTASPITGLDPQLAAELGLTEDSSDLASPSPDASLPSPRLRGEGGEARSGEPGEGHSFGGDAPSPALP